LFAARQRDIVSKQGKGEKGLFLDFLGGSLNAASSAALIFDMNGGFWN
jgi:hypothetical protein